jgi:protoheme IX farnesyltransferase
MRISETTDLTRPSMIGVARDYFELTKPKISALVLVSMGIGYALGSGAAFSWLTLLHASIGTLLIAGGTSAYNMFIERDLDALMKRTSQRPLPTKRIRPTSAFVFSTFLIFAGLSYLMLQVNLTAALVSACTTVLYLWAYTPMKRVSYHNVFVGAVPGALPPVGGWAAATGNVTDWGMWFLFIIVFLWQIPHVMAIAWMYGEEYTKAGFKMLPHGDLTGRKTSWISLFVILLLLPTILGLYLLGTTSWIYLLGALPSTLFYIHHGWRFKQDRSREHARSLMFASLAYLPMIWIFVLVDRILIG